MLLQKNEIKLQREELKLQREELKLQRDELELTRNELKRTADAQESNLKIQQSEILSKHMPRFEFIPGSYSQRRLNINLKNIGAQAKFIQVKNFEEMYDFHYKTKENSLIENSQSIEIPIMKLPENHDQHTIPFNFIIMSYDTIKNCYTQEFKGIGVKGVIISDPEIIPLGKGID